jgi:hypothetical protein
MNGCTDLSLEGIRAHARKQLGLDETENAIASRKNTRIVTLTEGQWAVVERVLAFTEKMKEINADVVDR